MGMEYLPQKQGMKTKTVKAKQIEVRPMEMKQTEGKPMDKPAKDIPEKRDTPLENLLDMSSTGMLKGFIYSQIFGLPKSKRRGR